MGATSLAEIKILAGFKVKIKLTLCQQDIEKFNFNKSFYFFVMLMTSTVKKALILKFGLIRKVNEIALNLKQRSLTYKMKILLMEGCHLYKCLRNLQQSTH